MHIHTKTAFRKIIVRRTGSQWRLRRTEVMWSQRCAPDLRRASLFLLIVSVVFEYQLLLPAEPCSSPVDDV